MSKDTWYERCSPLRQDEWASLKGQVEKEGYGAFRELVEQFKAAIKSIGPDKADEVYSRIAAAQSLFPEPALFSPTWQSIWKELKDTLHWKLFVFQSVPEDSREGEWQILMDNPFTNQDIVCYPGLAFVEAANLFGYFRPTLVNNEYLRLQKVQTKISESGALSKN